MIEARIIKGCKVNQEFLLTHYMSRCVVYLSGSIFSRIPAFGMMSNIGVASSEGGKTRKYNCFCDELILANFGRNLLHFWKHLTAVSGTKEKRVKVANC